jgi:hypothetical protein
VIAPAAAASAAIPFSPASSGAAGGNFVGLGVAVVLLVLAWSGLWLARSRGWLTAGARKPAMANDLAVHGRLRLSATCTAYVVGNGEQRVLVVESRHQVCIRTWSGSRDTTGLPEAGGE